MSLWTVQQHEWLQALGHPVLLLAGDPALTVRAPVAEAVAVPVGPAGLPAEAAQKSARQSGAAVAASKRVNPIGGDEPLRGRKPPGAHGASNEAEPKKSADITRPRTDAAAKKAALDEARRASRPARPVGQAQQDVLLVAIARATGLDAAAADQLMATQSVDLEKLRTDPSAKRALWLQLRRQRGGRNR